MSLSDSELGRCSCLQIPIESDDNQSGSESEGGGAGEREDSANTDEDQEAASEGDQEPTSEEKSKDENSMESQDSMASDFEVSMNSEGISGDDVGMMEEEEEREGEVSRSTLNEGGSCGEDDSGTLSTRTGT